nr:uroporphyrinogen-III synthase [uncultured Roseateles sp.]
MRLVLTRPQGQAPEWQKKLAALGVQAESLPLLEIAPSDGRDAALAWAALPAAALAFFVSPNAVEHFFARRSAGQVWPAQTLAACVGPGSAKALQAFGVPAALIVQPPADAASLDSEHLWPLLSGLDWQGKSVLLLRGEGGREWLAERLRERGAQTQAFCIYRRRCPVLAPPEQALLARILAQPCEHVWLFSSAEGVGHLASLTEPGQDWSQALCICTHERIAAAARELGFTHVVLTRPDPQAVQQALRRLQGDPYNHFHRE